jgi:hypothetical protein
MLVLVQGADIQRHIDTLSAFDYDTRTRAARLLRRASPAEVVPALADAARSHADQFVRYRALVLLTSFNARQTADLMRGLLADRNDRVREVVYRWYEHHPDPTLRATLLAALDTEEAEFVRPALVRALAALPPDDLVRRTLVGEVGRGFDFFRSAVIEALGHRRAGYAVDAIAAVAALDGPLQDDAVLALGRIGGERGSNALAAIEKPAPAAEAAMRAAQCLMGSECGSHIVWLADAARGATRTDVVRAASAALAAVGLERPAARTALLGLGSTAPGRVREEAALALSSVALRQPDELVAWLSGIPEAERTVAIELLREGFERLEEDFAEEQFFAAARAAYWKADEGSAARALAESLIDTLEF